MAAILNYVRGVKRLLGRMPDVTDELRMAVGAVASNAHRAGMVIRRLRDLVQHGTVERRPASLSRLFEEARVLGLIDGSALGIECEVKIAPDADPVIVDEVQIQQVLINLIRNAVEAMDGCSRRKITIAARRMSSERVKVTVSDSGPGLPDNLLADSYEPFHSGKANGLK